jgi:hypothetical protein
MIESDIAARYEPSLACAREIQAERIYTWNVKHFQMVAPDLAGRIATPYKTCI